MNRSDRLPLLRRGKNGAGLIPRQEFQPDLEIPVQGQGACREVSTSRARPPESTFGGRIESSVGDRQNIVIRVVQRST
jgi:hypothetical protein